MISIKKNVFLLGAVTLTLLLSSSLYCEAETILTGKLSIENNIAVVTTAEDSLSLYIVSEELLAGDVFPVADDIDYHFQGYETSRGFIIYQLSVPDSDQIFSDEKGQPIMLSSNPQLIYSVDPRRCISCRLCIKPCPVDAITMRRGVAVIDQEKCISCGICLEGNYSDFEGCPVGAVKEEERE